MITGSAVEERTIEISRTWKTRSRKDIATDNSGTRSISHNFTREIPEAPSSFRNFRLGNPRVMNFPIGGKRAYRSADRGWFCHATVIPLWRPERFPRSSRTGLPCPVLNRAWRFRCFPDPATMRCLKRVRIGSAILTRRDTHPLANRGTAANERFNW